MHHSESEIILISNLELNTHMLNKTKSKICPQGCHIKFMVSHLLLTAKYFISNMMDHRGSNFYFQIPCVQILFKWLLVSTFQLLVTTGRLVALGLSEL